MEADGTLGHHRLILPKTITQWVAMMSRKDGSRHHKASNTSTDSVPLREPKHQMRPKCDAEHLPPKNWIERYGNIVRHVPRFLRSAHSIHGLRVACAVMSLAIGFYIRSSSDWFLKERLAWGLIAIILSMNRTAGSSTWAFICRLLATAVTMVAAYVIWYIVDTKTAGVITFLWVYLMILAYFSMLAATDSDDTDWFLVCKFPHLTPAVIVAVFAAIIMIGNELQNRKLGTSRVEAAGQAALPEYKLAPQRLAITALGLVVAYFWTIFPYPLSEHTELRQDLSRTLYLLASYNSIVTQTIIFRAKRTTAIKKHHEDHLSLLKRDYYTKIQSSLGRLRSHLMFTKFQIILGGRFPKDKYAEMTKLCDELFTAVSVMDYASSTIINDEFHRGHADQARWRIDFQKLLPAFGAVADEVTSTLLTLSTHLATSSRLSPSTRPIQDFRLAKELENVNEDVWHVDRLSEPGYTAFVTLTMVSRGVLKALGRQVE